MAEQFPADMVREVAQLLRTTSLAEIALEEADNRLTLRRAAPIAVPVFESSPEFAASETSEFAGAAVSSDSLAEDGTEISNTGIPIPSVVEVVAPCVGVFRTASEPLEVGTRVKRKQLLGAVESLNVPNEIYAPGAGTITAWHAQDGQGVEWGQILVELEPAREEDAP